MRDNSDHTCRPSMRPLVSWTAPFQTRERTYYCPTCGRHETESVPNPGTMITPDHPSLIDLAQATTALSPIEDTF